MGGKVSLILVMAFSVLFALFGRNILNSSVQVTENFSDYYSDARAHAIAISGANMAINKLFLDKNWMAGIPNKNFSGGILDVDIDSLGYDSRKITSVGDYNGKSSTVEIVLEPENFAIFGNFYNVMGSVWWATGDTLQGRFHTNDYINCYGDPVFLGPATTSKTVKPYDKYSHPEFHGSKKENIDPIPLEFDTSVIRIAAYTNGKIFRDTTNSGKPTYVDLNFQADGNVKYKIKIGTGSWSAEQTTPLNTLAPNGVIYVEKGNIIVQGSLNGRATIVASQKGTDANLGQIQIANSIQYAANPLTDPNCDDMLGMVAENKVRVLFDGTRGNINIHGSIFSQKDGLVIDSYSSYDKAYIMNLVGGIIGHKVQPTATYKLVGGKYVPVKGYSYNHKFDTRFTKKRPPYFPGTKYYRVVSWYE
jgi:hypothetical protein